MGLFSIEKNNKNNSRSNNNKKKKYMDFNPNNMPQLNLSQPNNRGQVEQSGMEYATMPMPKVKENNEYFGTFDSKSVKHENKNESENISVIAPTGVAKQKIFHEKNNDISKGDRTDKESKDLNIPNVADSYEMQAASLDPLENSSNPIPVNPVAPVQDELVDQDIDFKNVKANLFSVFGMIIGMVFKPGTTIINNAKKYKSSLKALIITTWITLLTLFSCVIVRLVVGAFVKTSNVITGATSIQFNPALLFQPENYVEYLAIAFLVSAVAIFITALVYYASSFVNGKGIPFGSYIMISNLSFLPFILGVVVLYPVFSIFTRYIGLAVVVFTFLYTLITFFIGMNRILIFRNVDRQILYNVLNLSVIIMIFILIVLILLRADILILPDLVI